MPNFCWELPTTKMRFNLGERNLEEGRTYTQWTCEETIDETTGEPVLTRIVSDTSKPAIELYDTTADCVTQATTNYAYYKGAVPVVMFSAVLLLMLLLNKTRLGRRMRAVADNPELAASSGINVERVHMTSAFLSAGISGMGGAIFALTLRFNPETAFTLLLPSFAIIVLGTIGSIPGAIIGSLVVGFVRALSSPVLIGIGLPLGRSNYSALDGVMPYIFLVAILMIMPEGIGDAYEKWKIDRLRKRKEYDPDKSDKITAALAILPTGIFGLHHWWRNRTDKMQNFSAVAIAAYAFHRFSNFVGRNSFANGCGDVCQDNEFVDSNLAVLTGRNDGPLQLEDSPLDESDLLGQKSPPDGLTPAETEIWTTNEVAEMNESWLNQMNFEIDLVNFIVDLGDILWPWAFVLLWVYSIYEGISILQGKYETQGSQNVIVKINEIISSISIKFTKLQTQILLNWSEFDRKHDQIVKQIREKISQSSSGFTSKVSTESGKLYSNILDKLPIGSADDKQNLRSYGRESPIGSWLLFGLLMFILILFLAWLPIAESDDFRFKKVLQVSNVLLTLSIFILMSFSLNLHTGYTGMVNFGVIFFVAIGTITVGILTAPENLHGYDWAILPALLIALLLAAAFGWALAYPTARLRTDYFAIVTISLGEIVRVLLAGEPLLRVGAVGNAIGISSYPLPFEDMWFCGSETSGPDTNWVSPDACRDDPNLTDTPAYLIGEWLNLGEPAPYMFLLMIMSVVAVILVWILLNRILSSPWGRILKAIREDEEVAQHHGHDVLTHKAASLALGASIAALAGAFWAWKLTGFEPSFMSPARSTFLVWAAFIIGGTSNNRGMVVGAFIIVLMEFVFNVLVAGQGSADLPLHTTAARIDSLFEWLILSPWEVVSVFLVAAFVGFAIRSERILEIGLAGVAVFSFTAIALGQRSIDESFFGGVVSADMLYFKLFLIGCLMLFSLKFNTKGLLPEVPVRPECPNGGEAVE
jgi:ABC-type branched-subunit amino acid transport system permease subunit